MTSPPPPAAPPPDHTPPDGPPDGPTHSSAPAAGPDDTPPPASPDTPSASGPTDATAPAPGTRPARRWGRTLALLAAALLLGSTTGLAVGYHVQADRDPDPLPPLAREELVLPAEPADRDPAPLPAGESADLRAAQEGDLRKLLVEPPADAEEPLFSHAEDGWSPVGRYAERYLHTPYVLDDLVHGGLRRVAVAHWMEGEWREITVELVQFRETPFLTAADFLAEQQGSTGEWLDTAPRSARLPGDPNGRHYLWEETLEEPGYLPLTWYEGRVLARRGDIVMDIRVSDTERPLDEDALLDLAREQLERL